MNSKHWRLIAYVGLMWLIVSTGIFRLRYPCLTETELFLHIPEALVLMTMAPDPCIARSL
jgi:hypothetical protein